MILSAKEKAKELVDKMWIYALPNANGSWQNAKECALIAVDEIIKSNPMVGQYPIFYSDINYWEKVKKEIEKL